MNRRPDRSLAASARTALPFALLATLAVSAGCGGPRRSASAPSPMGGRGVTTITRDEIAAMGARTAWDVVRARAPRLFSSGEQAGRPTDLRIQEPRSINADETPLVVVDGVAALDLNWLTELPATEIVVIQIFDAEAAQPVYGLRAAGGAIVITTRGAR